MNNSQLAKRNIIASVTMQLVTIAYGFIIPKLLLMYFGSTVYGLVSSLTQFLSYIQLLEGGLTGVIIASLYKPLADGDMDKVSGIIKATNNFFKQIAYIYIAYVLIVAFLYPVIIDTDFSYSYVFSLTIILALTNFIQYFFALSYRILINADRKGYIVSLTTIAFMLMNLALTLVVLLIFPNIHLAKFAGVLSFVVQPIIFGRYVNKKYDLKKDVEPDKDAISQRWNGFGQNLAYFIHTNTDVVVLTFFAALTDVSVYSVYYMIVCAIKVLVISVSSAISPSMGNVLVSDDLERKQKVFEIYEFGMNIVSTFMFTCCAVLIVPFVQVYTANVTDADYYQPLFAITLTVAEALYCLRDPYVAVAYGSGHFKETAKFAYVEAILNIVISIALVSKLGLVGIAIGTLVSMAYRMIMHVFYLKDKLIFHSPIKWFGNFVLFVACGVISAVICSFVDFIPVTNYFMWFVYALIVAVIVVVITVIVLLIFKRKILIEFCNRYLLKRGI